METVTPAGLPPEDAPAQDMTGPDLMAADLPPRWTERHSPSTGALVLAALAGFSLAALIGGRRRTA